jgi:hypothetical protein
LTLGLLCLTRPDAPLFVAAAVVAMVCARRLSMATLRWVACVLAGPALLVAAQMAFRLAYYHSAVPNTALVKLAPSLVHAQAGWRYLAGGVGLMWPFPWLAAAGVAALLLTRGARPRVWYPLISGLAWSGYVVLIGGDIFPAYRHLVVLMVAFAYVLADGGAVLVGRFGAGVAAQAVATLLTVAAAPVYARAQISDRQTQRAVKERWEWQGRDLALVLKSAFGRQRPLMAVTAAGCLPYWSGLPSLDMLGLNDYYLPRHPPPNMGEGPLGHELGDGQYVLDRDPDLIVFNVGTEPAYRAGDQLNGMPEFHRRYVPARIEAGGEAYLVYMNRYSPRIGVTASASGVIIPAFVFEGAPLRLDAAGRLVAPLAASAPLRATVQLDGGPWDAEIESRDAGRAAADVTTANGTVTITLRTSESGTIAVQSVTLRPRAL